MKALSDNIADIQNDNSYAYVDFTQGYKAGQEFDFSFSWVQEYMYTLNNGEVAYDYTPGWFDGPERRPYPHRQQHGLWR